MEFTTTPEVKMSDTALSNAVRIAAGIARMTSDGLSHRDAIKQTARMLDMSEAAVCHALTIGQDFAEDLRQLQAA